MERVWVPSETEGWTEGTVGDYSGEFLTVFLDIDPQAPLRVNKRTTIPLYDDSLLDVPDIIGLPELHEATLLWTLRERYNQRKIYTYIGPMIISVNPFESLPIYSEDLIRRYMSEEGLEPHLFAIAQNAWASMKSPDGKSQSIVISGESGAGKTEATKVVLKFLTYVASKSGGGGGNDLAARILATNPVLEAFGNAKTSRNNNSSRFGKFIKVAFEGVKIAGAVIDNYLLEKSRIVEQAEGERNYHIFYQLILGSSTEEKQKYMLYPDPAKYRYLTGGNMRIQGVDDARDFQAVKQAMFALGFDQNTVDQYFSLLSGILHLGNITFKDQGDSVAVDPNDTHLRACSSLLKVPRDTLHKKLTIKLFSIGGGVGRQSVREIPMTGPVAIQNRDALAKALYAAMFDNVVRQINGFLRSTQGPTHGSESRFIGVLDIYGFENFKKNTLEQFCINYANEKLHGQFSDHVFKAEQNEYQKEGVPWDSIQCPDNQPTLDLIEKQVLTMLIEEGQIPKGSSADWGRKLCEKLNKNPQFYTQNLFRNLKFGIHHYAELVVYDVEGFVEKNKDTMTPDLVALIAESKDPLIRSLFSEQQSQNQLARSPTNSAGRSASANKATILSKFKASLQLLIETLASTNVHYVRCIKPNDSAQKSLFEGKKVLTQLKSNGVIETVKLRKAGYANHLPHEIFLKRYQILGLRSPNQIGNFLRLTGCTEAHMGHTKVFLNDANLKQLDTKRDAAFRVYLVVFQKRIRGNLARAEYEALLERKKKVIVIQKYIRSFHAQRIMLRLKIEWIKRKNFLVSIMQAYVRGFNARLTYQILIKEDLKRKLEEAKRRREEEARLRAEEERRRADDETKRRRAEEENVMRTKLEEARRAKEEREMRAKLEEARRKKEEDARRVKEEDTRGKEQEEKRRKAEEIRLETERLQKSIQELRAQKQKSEIERRGGLSRDPSLGAVSSAGLQRDPSLGSSGGGDYFNMDALSLAPAVAAPRPHAPSATHRPVIQASVRPRSAQSQSTPQVPPQHQQPAPRAAPPPPDIMEMTLYDDDDICDVLEGLCHATRTNPPSQDHFDQLGRAAITHFSHVRMFDEQGWKLLVVAGFPVVYQQLFMRALDVADKRAGPYQVPVVAKPYEAGPPSKSNLGGLNSTPEPKEGGILMTRIKPKKHKNDGLGDFWGGLADLFKIPVPPADDKEKDLHPMKIFDPPVTPMEEANCEMFFPLCQAVFINEDVQIKQDDSPAVLAALSLVATAPHEGEVWFHPSEHLPPHFANDDDIIDEVQDIYPEMSDMNKKDAQIQYVRLFKPHPMFFFNVADRLPDNTMFGWRLGVDSDGFYRYVDGNLQGRKNWQLVEKMRAYPESNIFEIALIDSKVVSFVYEERFATVLKYVTYTIIHPDS